MKICITAQGDSLDSEVDPRFGRCQYFIFVDLETSKFEAIKNSNIDATNGAGIQSSQFIVDSGVKTIITGNIGPNALHILRGAGIEVITGVSGSVKEIIEAYKTGRLNPINNMGGL